MARLSIGVSADAKEASSEFKALAEDIKKVGTESVGVTEGIDRVDAALAKLARAADTPGSLATAVAKTKVEVEALRAELDKTPASAEKLKSIEAALAKADAAMDSAIARAGKLTSAQAGVNARVAATAKGMEGAAAATGKLGASTGQLTKDVISASGVVGPYGGLIDKLSTSGGSAAASLANLAFKVTAVAAAAKLGWDIGRKLDEEFKKLGIDLSDPISQLGKLEEALRRTPKDAEEASYSIGEVVTGVRNLKVGLANLDKPTRDFVLGLIDMARGARDAGKATTGLAADIDLESAALTEHTKRLAAQVVARAAQRRATAEADAAVKGAISGWKSAADQQKELDATIEAVAKKLGDLQKTGADWRAEVEANEEPLQRWVESLREGNVTISALPQPLQDAISHLDSLAKKHDEGAAAAKRHAAAEDEAAKKARENAANANRTGAPVSRPADPNAREGQKVIEETTEGLKKQADAANEVADAAMRMQLEWEAAGAAQRDHTTAVEAAERAQQDFGTSLDYVAKKVVEAGGELSVGAPVLLSLAAAEDAVTAALYRRLEATKLLREEQMASLGVAEGWLAYISNIEASMAQGITSTTVGIGLLADFQRQLQTMFAGATGDAKKVIDDVTDAIRALIATATGGTLDLSPLGQLEREIERKRGGR